MAGWIKMEKDLREDPRFLRMLRLLVTSELKSVTDVTQVRITERRCVTLLLGALAQLWMYADSYLREDDTLDLGPDEIDQLVGIDGFCQMMPEDWLEVIDEHRVKLPGFHEFNGTEAKKKALTAKRVARHRIRNVTQGRITDTSACNVGALPDQTRPDQTRHTIASAKSSAAPRETPRSRKPFLKARGLYPEGLFAEADWLIAEREFEQRVDEGVPVEDLVAAAGAYELQQRAKGAIGSQFVLSPAKFWQRHGRWRGPFPLPEPTDPEAQAKQRREAAEAEAMKRAMTDASAIQCPLLPRPLESAAVFATRVADWKRDNVREPMPPPRFSPPAAKAAGDPS